MDLSSSAENLVSSSVGKEGAPYSCKKGEPKV